jgi:hypothetical protein
MNRPRQTLVMIGQRIGHYIVEENLGEGGMGVAFRAHEERRQRAVALKFLETPPTGESAGHERVLPEARAVSALNHPNICTIYEVGEANGKPFIAMEYIESRPLSQEIGWCSPKEAISARHSASRRRGRDSRRSARWHSQTRTIERALGIDGVSGCMPLVPQETAGKSHGRPGAGTARLDRKRRATVRQACETDASLD